MRPKRLLISLNKINIIKIIYKSSDTLWAPLSPSSSGRPPVSEVPSKYYLTRTVWKAFAFEASSFLLGVFQFFF